MRIENLSISFNLARGHQKRTKKLKEREKEEEEELKNHCICSCEKLRRKKKMEKNRPIKKKTEAT